MAYFFKLPPITDLTIGQQAALNEPNAIAISGGPGTGKSVVSLWRHIQNHAMGRHKSLLLTYTKTLEMYFKMSVLSEAKKAESAKEKYIIKAAANEIGRTYDWLKNHKKKYEEIIVDEAQDVHVEKYREMKPYANYISYGADFGQSLYLSDSELEELEKELPKLFKNNHFELDENFRNTLEIIRFTRSIFANKRIENSDLNGPKPFLSISKNIDEQKDIIKDIIRTFSSETHNIAILLPKPDEVRAYHNFVKKFYPNCTYYHFGKEMNEISNIHITTFKSAKGVEFDTVIIPGFHKMPEVIKDIDRYKSFDEEDYYVALTRAKRNLYLLCIQPPNFLSKRSIKLCNT